MEKFNDMQLVKRRFFAMRNGIVADTLRKGGSPYKIIFGLNLPQIKEIAADWGTAPDLGRRLWADCRTRESMLLAPYLLDRFEVDAAEALAMVDSAPAAEAIDILAMALLRRAEWSRQLLATLVESADTNPARRYAALRLAMNLADEASLAMAESLAQTSETGGSFAGPLRAVARQVREELAFLRE